MSPKVSGRRIAAGNNLYTVILAMAVGVVVATAVFVAYKCYFQYGTVFSMP